MDKKDLSYKLRSILHRNRSVERIISEMKALLKVYGYKAEVHIIENQRGIFVDIFPHIQYLKKRRDNKIYEVVPENSPLKKYTEIKEWKKQKAYLSKQMKAI